MTLGKVNTCFTRSMNDFTVRKINIIILSQYCHIHLPVNSSPSLVSALSNILFCSVTLNSFLAWTLLSHSLRYGINSSSSHYDNKKSNIKYKALLHNIKCRLTFNLESSLHQGSLNGYRAFFPAEKLLSVTSSPPVSLSA